MSGLPASPVETQSLPLLPLRDVVVFPHMVTPLFVGIPSWSIGLTQVNFIVPNSVSLGWQPVATLEPEVLAAFKRRTGCPVLATLAMRARRSSR